MRVLIVHNHYQQPGGEDRVVAAEGALLEAHGHAVERFTAHNDDVEDMNALTLGAATIWNHRTYRALRERIERTSPDVVHVHNTLPLISPAVYYAARHAGRPVVQTLHNYRLLCPSALLLRDGAVCTDCVGRRVAWPSVAHACYRDSRAATGTIATMLAAHHALGTWHRHVDVYIALTEIARRLFVDGGLPEDKIHVKPHFVAPDPGMGAGEGGYALFVGRLSEEKGLSTLLDAWSGETLRRPLRIVGGGPLAPQVAAAGRQRAAVSWLGRRSADEVAALMRAAAFLVMPSECYETFGRVVIEAYAAGTPVVVADGGAPAELVEPGRTGLLFRRGDAADLARQAHSLTPEALLPMRAAARRAYEQRYTAERNLDRLLQLYDLARRAAASASVPPTPVSS